MRRVCERPLLNHGQFANCDPDFRCQKLFGGDFLTDRVLQTRVPRLAIPNLWLGIMVVRCRKPSRYRAPRIPRWNEVYAQPVQSASKPIPRDTERCVAA